jgi:creatinine amidohydrolase
MRSLLWEDLTRTEICELRDQNALVIIPTGAIEQHADFLSTDTDIVLSSQVAIRAAERVTKFPVVVAPLLPFGFSPHHLSWPGTISLRLETFLAVLTDMVKSIFNAGFKRALFVNGHGGNEAPLRALCGQLVTDGYAVGMTNYFTPSEPSWIPLLKGDLKRGGHACEQETALMLALHENDPEEQQRILKLIEGLPARTMQPWMAPNSPIDPITEAGAGWPPIFHADDCGYYGDPGKADIENGKLILEATVERLARFFTEYGEATFRLGVAPDAAKPGFAKPLA